MFKSKALMLRVCAGTAVTLLTLSVQPLEARHSLVPRDGFVKNCVRFLGEHWQDKSKLGRFQLQRFLRPENAMIDTNPLTHIILLSIIIHSMRGQRQWLFVSQGSVHLWRLS
jgi:hypothetical protein